MAINRCQYWNTYEPSECVYWDSANTSCTYVAENKEEDGQDVKPPLFYPLCNYLGTAVACPSYSPSVPGTFKTRCILPDPTRHVCNRFTGKKWIAPELPLDFSNINGYNDGTCDGSGTNTTCSGYSPQHMGFGRLVPSSSGELDLKKDDTYSLLTEFDIRLPLHFVVYNLRAELSKCKWWDGDYVPFTVNSGTQLVELGGTWVCTSEQDTSSYSDFNNETGPPCNGCKAECPYYSGVCWEYCIDELLQSGDPVLAEQVHELRYYCKEGQWTSDALAAYFVNQGYIYTWGGSRFEKDSSVLLRGDINYTVNSESNTIDEYQIPSVKTYMDSFDIFNVKYDNLVLTKGTSVEGELITFPHLVQNFSLLELAPIIKNKFEVDGVYEAAVFGEVSLLLYGKVFTPGEVFVLNISHSSIGSLVPKELFSYDSLLDIKLDKGTKAYQEFYTMYEKTIKTLKRLTVTGKNLNKLSDTLNTTFIVEGPLYAENELLHVKDGSLVNTLVVFQDTAYGLLFSKINVVKSLVGGALLQTSFSIEGDNTPVRALYDYTQGFNAHINKDTGSMVFEFFPFSNINHTYAASYFYDDYVNVSLVGTIPTETSTEYRGHYLYKITSVNYILSDGEATYGEPCEYYRLGEDGYFLIQINHTGINNVFQPWEFDRIFASFEDGSSCDFEKVFSGADSSFLEVNQMIVKPKNEADFKSICSAIIIIENLTYYKKLSFEEIPVVSDGWEFSAVDASGESLDINYNKTTYDVSYSDNVLNISNFQFIMVPSVVISNRAGRDFSVFRTRPLGWVKQVACPAVEIYYSWAANYTQWSNSPTCRCCGEWSEVNAQQSGYSLTPPCGDHDISAFTGVGPIWWPFNGCDPYATYDIISNLDNYSFDVIGLFKQTNEDGNKIHGDHDMRMLGPANNIAFHGRGCNFLIPCSCNWRTTNNTKSGDNFFTGWGRIRSGVSMDELLLWENDQGVLPKFGNSNRPQFDSYRTIGKEQYLKTSDGGSTWTTAWKLMPAFMTFTKADFLDKTTNSVWDYGGSAIENAPSVNNPLGFFLATSFEGTSVNENVDYVNRFTLGEICHTNLVVDSIRYPKVAGEYASSKKGGTIYPWYEFKAYNPPKTAEDLITDDSESGSSGNVMVQWAWQEKWKSLERITSEEKTSTEFIRELVTSFDSSFDSNYILMDDSEALYGSLLFLDVSYPDYLYNYKLDEFTTTTTEGYHVIQFIAPEKDLSTGNYLGYICLKLDDGPMRAISWKTRTWLAEDSKEDSLSLDGYNVELYNKCTGQEDALLVDDIETSWFDGVTLFDSTCTISNEALDKAADTAEENNQMVQSYKLDGDGKEITKKLCFQRGLAFLLNSEAFEGKNLPTTSIPVLFNADEFNTVVGEGAAHKVVCNTTIYIDRAVSFDYKVKTISSLEMTYFYGADPLIGEDENTVYNYYHIPAIKIYSSEDGITKDFLLYENATMTLYIDNSIDLSTNTLVYSWDNTLEYIYNGASYIIIELRVSPNAKELSELSDKQLSMYEASLNYVKYEVYEVYESVLANATESVRSWERKYYVSYGNSGDSPPQGNEPSEISTLYPREWEKSTVYTKDTSEGVLNMDGSDKNGFTITSKIRGRVLHEIYEDNKNLDGDLYVMEGKQKKIFDSSLKVNPENALMYSIVPPSLEEYLVNEGVSFLEQPVNLILKNTLLTELAEINNFKPISGEGHKYLPSEYHHGNCKGWCGAKEDAVFEYVFTALDEEANGGFTGQSYRSAFDMFYFGTYLYMERKNLADLVIENVFNKEYGASSATKIWVDSEESSLLFTPFQPLVVTTTTAGTPSYNLQYLAASMNWHNAYFNTSELSGESLQF